MTQQRHGVSRSLGWLSLAISGLMLPLSIAPAQAHPDHQHGNPSSHSVNHDHSAHQQH